MGGDNLVRQEFTTQIATARVSTKIYHGSAFKKLRVLEEAAGDFSKLCKVFGESKPHDFLLGDIEFGKGWEDVFGKDVRITGPEIRHSVKLCWCTDSMRILPT